MRHRVAGYKLGRDAEHRTAMFRNLASGLFQHGQITTTLQKAKAVQPFVEKLITLAKKGDLHARRRSIAILGHDRFLVDTLNGYEDGPDVERDRRGKVVKAPTLIHKLFDEIGPNYSDRPGGYTRIIKLAKYRIGDGSNLVVLQLVGDEEGPTMPSRPSRRRKMQDNRTAFAAKLRKGGATETAEVEEEKPEVEAEVAETETAPEKTPEAEAPAETEASTEETTEQEKTEE